MFLAPVISRLVVLLLLVSMGVAPAPGSLRLSGSCCGQGECQCGCACGQPKASRGCCGKAKSAVATRGASCCGNKTSKSCCHAKNIAPSADHVAIVAGERAAAASGRCACRMQQSAPVAPRPEESAKRIKLELLASGEQTADCQPRLAPSRLRVAISESGLYARPSMQILFCHWTV